MSGWHWYWTIWFGVSFLAFLGPEIYALVTNWRNTLSEAVWTLEDAQPHQAVSGWSAAHFLFGGAFLLLAIWLSGHFLFQLWR